MYNTLGIAVYARHDRHARFASPGASLMTYWDMSRRCAYPALWVGYRTVIASVRNSIRLAVKKTKCDKSKILHLELQ